MRLFSFSILFFFLSSLLGANYQVGTLDALSLAKDGDSISLAPGTYSGSVSLDKKYNSEAVFILQDINLSGSGERFTIDLKGKNITLILINSTITGGNEATIGVRGDYCKILGNNATLKDANFGLLLLGTNHHVEGLTFIGQNTGGIAGNNLKLDPETRNFSQGFNWGPANNWRITKCSFYDIAPRDPGNAGGAIRLIPHVKSVVIDNCYFENIKGNAVWFDHYMDELEIYRNTFKRIEYKCIFLEISDPDPANKGKFGAKVAGNVSRENQRHGIFVAASSDVEIWGNDMEGWPVVLGGMQRDFYRRYDVSDQSTWVRVDAELKNNHIHQNVLKATEGRNHIMVYDGVRSGNNTIFNNYYITGNVSNFKSTPITDAHFSINDGKFLHNIDKKGLNEVDPSGITGPDPATFPFPEAWDNIPVEKGGDLVIIDPPGNDTTNTDTTVVPPPARDRPSVWIISDLSSGRTDPDDRVSAAMILPLLDHVNLKGFTVGSHKWDLTGSLTWFNQNLGNAYTQEQPALNSVYGGFPSVLPMYEATTTGRAFKEGNIKTLEGSLKAMYEAAQEVVSNGEKFYVLLWGPQNEAAYFMDYASRQVDQRVFLNTVFISHASSPSDLNNCSRDPDACAFLHKLAAEGKIIYFELGFAGKVIDNKTFPKISTEVLKSKIGHYLQEKWQAEKPDGSDAITFFVAFVEEVGGGIEYLFTLKSDGSSNMDRIMADFTKQPIYDILEERYGVASSGKTDNNPDPGQGGQSDLKTLILKKMDEVEKKQNELRALVNQLK